MSERYVEIKKDGLVVGHKLVVDRPPSPPKPVQARITNEELAAKLDALTAKVDALTKV